MGPLYGLSFFIDNKIVYIVYVQIEKGKAIMARLPYPDPSQLTEETRQGLALLPVPLNIFRMLATTQTALTPTLMLGKAILVDQELAANLRELAILQVAKQAEASYEWAQHALIARTVGVTDEQITLVEQGILDTPALNLKEKLVLGVAKDMVLTPHLSNETFTSLKNVFSPREIVELLLTIGYYLMLARIATALEIDHDPPSGPAVAEAARKR